MLFMAGMHLAIFSPKTGKLKELKVAGMPHNGPCFCKAGFVWLSVVGHDAGWTLFHGYEEAVYAPCESIVER